MRATSTAATDPSSSGPGEREGDSPPDARFALLCAFGWAPGAILGSRVGSKVSTPVASKNMQGVPRLRLPSPHFSLSSHWHWPQVDGRTLRSLAIFLKTGFSGFQVSQERSSKAISVRQAIDLPIDYYRAGYRAKAAQIDMRTK